MKVNSIFIIDDDGITIFGLRKLLENISKDFTINEFRNGRQALDAINDLMENKQDLPELIFLDINMPVMDGWSFLEEFTKIPESENVRIKVITSSISATDQDRWVDICKNTNRQIDFVNKPLYQMDLADISKMGLAS